MAIAKLSDKITSNLKAKPSRKIFSSLQDWGKTVKTTNALPEFHANCIGKNRYFSARTNSGELYKVRVTYDKINTHLGFIHATISLHTSINGTVDEYMFHVVMNLDQSQHWKPTTFSTNVHNDNTHDYAETMLVYLKSPASKFTGNVRKYLIGDKISDTPETHKNMMGCLLKNGFSQFYSAATQQRKKVQA